MKSETEVVEAFKGQGYDNVYVWSAQAGEREEDHMHPFDTAMYILEGELRVTLLREDHIEEFLLRPGQEIEVLRGQQHKAVAGEAGCKYVLAEMH